MAPHVTSLDHLVLTVADIDRTIAFYRDALGMELVTFGDPLRHALRFGTQKINLHLAGQELEPKARRPGPGTADLCFLTGTALSAWQEHLAQCGVEVEDGPVPRTGAMGPITSIYLRDPDGNLIEISEPV